MKKSLRAFMKGIIDYAGLFPPADLSLDTSIRKFAQYRQGADAEMLSRFIIPASRLDELEAYKEELFDENPPFDFSVLGKGTDIVSDFEKQITNIVEACWTFHQYHGSSVTTDILETKLPKEAALSGDSGLIKGLLDDTAQKFSGSDNTPDQLFYEIFWEENWKKDIATTLQAIAKHNEGNAGLQDYDSAGFKIRCGGVEPHMFPSPEQMAYAINCAREYNVAIKCTAGLHHPIRHYNDSVSTKMHGFINVFGGAMLAWAHDLTDDELIEILIEEDSEKFAFEDELFSWNDYSISTEKIVTLRETALISYGSCSFDEPREDLHNLGLIYQD